jgi:ketosteroid isomerase-like protein
MSQTNMDAIRRTFEADSRHGDLNAILGMLAPDVVWDLSRSPFPEARLYHGPEGVQEWLLGLRDAFGDVRYEVEDVADLGGERVLLVIRVRGHGNFSKIDVDYRFVPVFTFRDDKIVRMDRYGDRTEALKAVGLAS